MVRKTSKRAAQSAKTVPFQPRHLLLAGIGAVSLGRKQVIEAYANGVVDAAQIGSRAQEALQAAAQGFVEQAQVLRKQAQAKAAPLRRTVVALASEAGELARVQLAPVFARLGVKAPARPRKAARRKPAAARGSRKAA